MAESQEPSMATSGYVSFQYILMSAISVVLTILVLLVCGFCMRFKKQRSHYLNGTNSSLKRAPTQLLKLSSNQDVFTLNETKMVAGIKNGSYTATEPEEQANRKVEINGDVISSQAGQKPDANGPTDPQGVPVQNTQFSLKHRRLPSVPYATRYDVSIHQLSSNQNAQVDPVEPPAYEELFAGKFPVDVRSSSEDLEGRAAGNSNDVEEELQWPPIPHVTFLNMNVYSDVDNVSTPNNQAMVSVEPTVAEHTDGQHTHPSVQPPGEVLEASIERLTPISVPVDISWRFHHLPLESGTENVTNLDKKEARDLYSKVKKSVKHSDSVTTPSFDAVTEQDDDPPPPVPIKHFNIEGLQGSEDPLPPPPIIEME